MRLVVAIPHYYADARASSGAPRHGSLAGQGDARAAGLAAAIESVHTLYGEPQRIVDIRTRRTVEANRASAGPVEVIVCTTKGRHLIDRLALPAGSFIHMETSADPHLLGYECHVALRDRLGHADYYGYMEDDLIVRDPWMLIKLDWFCRHLGDLALLQPNRYEVSLLGPARKAYIDGDIEPRLSDPFQDRAIMPSVRSEILGQAVHFMRPTNPHAGCFFLNRTQMETWARRPDFLDRSTEFIGPLESAATLGIMRTFRVYKPAADHSAFLEVEHRGTGFIGQLRRANDASK